jgi:hypothetical protein
MQSVLGMQRKQNGTDQIRLQRTLSIAARFASLRVRGMPPSSGRSESRNLSLRNIKQRLMEGREGGGT